MCYTIYVYCSTANVLRLQAYTDKKRKQCNSCLYKPLQEATGCLSESLSDYKFTDASCKQYITYENSDHNFQLRYHTGAPETAMHFYNFDDNPRWKFYDD